MYTIGNVSSQSFQNLNNLKYLKLSNLTKITGIDIVESIIAIELSDEKKTALNILSKTAVILKRSIID